MMLNIIFYLPFLLINLVIMGWIIRKRGFISFEGLGVSCLMVVVSSDWLGLILSYFLEATPDTSIFVERIYPSVVQIIGLCSLMLGLTLADPNPVSVPRSFNEEEKKYLFQIGWFLIVLGFGMKIVSLGTEGITSITVYFRSMSSYVVTQHRLGGFLENGVAIMLFGLAIVTANQEKRSKQLLLMLAMFLLTFILSTSRGGIIGAIITLFVLLWVFNKKMLILWFRPTYVAALVALIILSAGYKSMIRTGNEANVDTSISALATWGISRYLDRFSNVGLYDSYVNFVNRVSEDALYYKGRVIEYALTAWVPHVIYENKPMHPFRGIGNLVYRDYRISLDDVSAVTLVGTVFADDGLLSVIPYLIIYGMILGFLRRVTVGKTQNLLFFIWYLHFMMIDGFSNFMHGGILNLMDTFALANGAILLCFIYLQVSGFLGDTAKNAGANVSFNNL